MVKKKLNIVNLGTCHIIHSLGSNYHKSFQLINFGCYQKVIQRLTALLSNASLEYKKYPLKTAAAAAYESEGGCRQ